MKLLRSCATIVMSLTALAGVSAAVVGLIHSDLFLVRVVEVNDLPDLTPVDAQTIIQLAQVPTDSVNLFSLRLAPIERRLLSHRWIKAVTLSKKFPQSVSISVEFHQPIAIVQKHSGSLYYMDADGNAFAPINLKSDPNLPILVAMEDVNDQKRALSFIHSWGSNGLASKFVLSSIEYHAEKGLRVMVTYPMREQVGRVLVELGQSEHEEFSSQLARLNEVMSYLSSHNIDARQVFADLGKKIVVRIARSS